MRQIYRVFCTIALKIVAISLLAGCSDLTVKRPDLPVQIAKQKSDISAFTGRPVGTSWSDIMEGKSKLGDMPVNALLWRAALDITSIVPLDDVDTLGGSIVTEWYVSKDQPNRRLKLAVFVVGLELRSDAIQVRTYVQTRDGDGWTNTGRDGALSRKLEDLILTRARELRVATVSETSK